MYAHTGEYVYTYSFYVYTFSIYVCKMYIKVLTYFMYIYAYTSSYVFINILKILYIIIICIIES